METCRRYFLVDRKDIAFIKFIIESYEGIATLTTIDTRKGIVVLCIAPGCEGVALSILSDLKKTLSIKSLEAEDILGKI